MKKRILSLLMVGAMTAGMLAGCGSKTDAPADNTAKEETPATEEAKEETPATEEKEAVEPVTLNVAYMPNYGSLWSVENAIAQGYLEEEGITVNLVEFQDGPTIISAMDISDRVLINFASTDRQQSLHYPISPMVMH